MDHFGNSDIGQKRKNNQDSFCICKISDRALLCAVFDGMGGHAGGETASRIASEQFGCVVSDTLRAKLDADTGLVNVTKTQVLNIMQKAVDIANTAVFEAAKENEELSGMGTTLAAVLINGSVGYAVNVGDSRIYRVKGGEISQISRDHSYVQYLIDLGEITEEEAKTNLNKSIITRAVGTEMTVEADTYSFDCEGSSILVCSDGLTNHIENGRLAELISESKCAQDAVLKLIDTANDLGGTDNITAVVVMTDNEQKTELEP